MQTMHPVIVFGSYLLDAENIPPDEFEVRLAVVQSAMTQHGWSALIAYGDPEDSAALTYLTNYLPRIRQAVVLIARRGPPRLLVWASARDIKRETAIAAVDDVRIAGKLDDSIGNWLADAGIGAGVGGGTIAVAGNATIRMPIYEAIQRAGTARGLALSDADASLGAVMQMKRPRELVVARRAAGVLERSVAALGDVWRDGATATDAVLAAEHAAFANEAVDARTLFSLDNGRTLRPFERPLPDRPDRLSAYVAVRYQAYWAEGFVTLSKRRSALERTAHDALDRMIAAASAGRCGAELAAAADLPADLKPHAVFGAQLGHGIGLSLQEAPKLTSQNDAEMIRNGVYSLTVGLSKNRNSHALVSAMIAIGADGAEVLWRAP